MKVMIKQLGHEEATNALQTYTFAKLEGVWADITWAARTSKLDPQQDYTTWFACCFAAERAIEHGYSKEAFLESMAQAFDLAAEVDTADDDDDDSDVEEAARAYITAVDTPVATPPHTTLAPNNGPALDNLRKSLASSR